MKDCVLGAKPRVELSEHGASSPRPITVMLLIPLPLLMEHLPRYPVHNLAWTWPKLHARSNSLATTAGASAQHVLLAKQKAAETTTDAALAKAMEEPGAIQTDSGLVYREVVAGAGPARAPPARHTLPSPDHHPPCHGCHPGPRPRGAADGILCRCLAQRLHEVITV